MKKKGNKIILFIVEGTSDETAFGAVKKIQKENKVKFKITHGDITSKKGVNAQNCIKKLNEHINIFCKETKLKATDIVELVHIVDMDGAYVQESNIKLELSADKFIYEDECIKASSIEKVASRNKTKKSVLEKLLITSTIRKIPYEIYYMSCELEHVLYDKRNVKSKSEKIKLSNDFACRFEGKEEEFIEFLNDEDFKVNGDYKETWNFIKQGTNSLKRYSNFYLFFLK